MSASALARKAAKAAVLPAGVPGRRRRGDVVVLLYHRVGTGLGEIAISEAAFREQLGSLARRDRVRPLERALADPEGGVVIAVDDGYRDFHDAVVPALVDAGVPAILYLATGLIEGERHAPADGEALTWTQLRQAVATGLVSVGSHTHGHVSLARASEAEATEEMRRSKELIEDRLGVACRHFAFPWGVGSAGAQRAARGLFATAALGGWRVNRARGRDPHRLSRVPVLRSDGRVLFHAKRRGLLGSEALLYRAARRGPWRRTL